MGHPRERGIFSGSLSRRDFIRRSAGTAFALSGEHVTLPHRDRTDGFYIATLDRA